MVVAPRREHRLIGRQRDGGKGAALCNKPPDEFSGEMLGEGSGKSKKEAEQAAARDAIKKLKDA